MKLLPKRQIQDRLMILLHDAFDNLKRAKYHEINEHAKLSISKGLVYLKKAIYYALKGITKKEPEVTEDTDTIVHKYLIETIKKDSGAYLNMQSPEAIETLEAAIGGVIVAKLALERYP